MNFKRIIIPLILFVSFGVSDDHKRKHRKIKRNKHSHPSKITQSSVSMRLNWHWSHWNHWWNDCRIHDRVVVVNQETDYKNKNKPETILMNFVRGSGLTGLAGIPQKRGKIIRPFLSFYRKDLEDYLKENKISFRRF